MPAATGVRPDTAHHLLARVARAQAEGRAPSLSVGVVRDGALVWTCGRGAVGADGAEPTPDTQYRIGSITKPFTALLIMQLRDEGALDLDDRLGAYVSDTRFGDSTLRDLLAHAAGLAAEPPGPWWERSPGVAWPELAASFGDDLMIKRTGTFHYSNPGYALLGRVVEQLRGVSWFEALREHVLEPLGMSRTTYDANAPSAPGIAVHPLADATMPEVVQDLAAMAPAGQLWSTVGDLARFAGVLCGDTGGVIAPASVAEMRSPQVLGDDPAWQAAYGLGVQVIRSKDRLLVGHGGSVPGFLAFIAVDVERRTGVIELANATGGAVFSGGELLEILERHEPTIMPVWRPAAVPADVLELTGTWFWGPNGYVISVVGADGLDLAPLRGRGRAARFRRRDDGSWVGLGGYWLDERLRVVRRDDGSIDHLDLATFVLTRAPYDPSAAIPGGVPSHHPWTPSPAPDGK